MSDVLARHAGLSDGEETDEQYRLAGRLTGRRGHGKAAFLDLTDRSGQIQLHARKDVLGDDYEQLVGLDLGDLIGVEGAPVPDPARRAVAAHRRVDDARQVAAPAAGQVPRARPTSSSATATASWT